MIKHTTYFSLTGKESKSDDIQEEKLNSAPRAAEGKNAWSYAFIPPYVYK